MRTMSKAVIAGCLLMTSVTLNSFGQTPAKTTEKHAKKPAKIEKTKVPKAVTETFVLEYPVTVSEEWYGYPSFVSDDDWYGYDPYLYEYNNPEYYIVEFVKDKTPHKVIYNKAGKKIAIHRKMNTELPKAVSEAISKGSYGSWKLGSDKEEIFRDSAMDKMVVYKVAVEKGTEKHELFYSKTGALLKDKTIK